MRATFVSQVKDLKNISNRFDKYSVQEKVVLLKRLESINLPVSKSLITYYDLLLFICAHPHDAEIFNLAENEMARITTFIQRNKLEEKNIFINSGLPFTIYVSGFSHDFVHWIQSEANCRITIQKFRNQTFDLNEVLKLTLPSLERSETTAGFTTGNLFKALLVTRQNQLTFIIKELAKLDLTPYIKDHLYQGLGIYTKIKSNDGSFSRAYNRLHGSKIFFHESLLKHFEYEKLAGKKLRGYERLTKIQRKQAIRAVKKSMVITDRETDPTTYMDESSFRLFNLDRGISVAIYGMIAQRQLPLESYAGYTLFKNGFPAAYGGGWIFGQCANFGINIFESFRGGESSYMMCQLLHVYRHVFNLSYFEIEPYQFGLDNPEGIESGVFWFYYRLGFRPADKTLRNIANDEYKKMLGRKHYRTKRETLIRFTESEMILNLGEHTPVKVFDITSAVTKMMQQKYNGDRTLAEKDCVAIFRKKASLKTRMNSDENNVLKEVALWAEASQIKDKLKLSLLTQMIKIKPKDLYKYQKLLLSFFNK